MAKHLWMIFFAALVVFSGPAAAQQDTKQVLVRGAGQETCAKWLRERSNWITGSSHSYLNWILGFIAAYNDFVHTQEPASNAGIDVGVENDPLISWIDQYCRAHPQDAIYAVSTALINDLKKR